MEEQFLHIGDADIEAGIFWYFEKTEVLHLRSLGMNLLIYWFKFEHTPDLETNKRMESWFQTNRVEPVVQSLIKAGKIQEDKIDPKGRFTLLRKQK